MLRRSALVVAIGALAMGHYGCASIWGFQDALDELPSSDGGQGDRTSEPEASADRSLDEPPATGDEPAGDEWEADGFAPGNDARLDAVADADASMAEGATPDALDAMVDARGSDVTSIDAAIDGTMDAAIDAPASDGPALEGGGPDGNGDGAAPEGGTLDGGSDADAGASGDGWVCQPPPKGVSCDPGYVQCNGAPCPLATSYCCVDPTTGTEACNSKGTSCAYSVRQCNESADCPSGQVCCGSVKGFAGSVPVIQVGCAASCVSSTGVWQECRSIPECTGGKQCLPQTCVGNGFAEVCATGALAGCTLN